MNKEKQIEEMAKLIKESCQKTPCYRDEQPYTDCDVCEATYLYNAGYRKASEVALEVLNKALSNIQIMISSLKQYEQTNIITEFNGGAKTALETVFRDIAELKKKYTEDE